MSTDSNSDHKRSVTDTHEEIPKIYSFERKRQYNLLEAFLIFYRLKSWDHEKDKTRFIHQLRLPVSNSEEVNQALDVYLNQSLRNVFYYRRKILVENYWRNLYAFVTLIIVTVVPIFIFMYTDKAVGGILPEELNPLQTNEKDAEGEENNGSDTQDSTSDATKTSFHFIPKYKENVSSNTDQVVFFEKQRSSTPIFVHQAVLQDSMFEFDPARGPSEVAENSTDPARSNTAPRNVPKESTANSVGTQQDFDKPTDTNKTPENTNPIDQAATEPSIGPLDPQTELDGLEAVGIILSALLTSLFALHNVVSQWAGKRKFRAHFHQAKMNLMEIHFELEELGQTTFKSEDNAYDVDRLTAALLESTKKCRKIVNEETRAFFELSATPVVDLGSVFSTSMTTANSLINSFTSKRYTSRVNELKKQQSESDQRKQNNENKKSANLIQLKVAYRKLVRMQKKDLELDDELNELEDIENPTQEERSRKLTIENRLYELRENYEELLESIELMEAELEEMNSTNSKD